MPNDHISTKERLVQGNPRKKFQRTEERKAKQFWQKGAMKQSKQFWQKGQGANNP